MTKEQQVRTLLGPADPVRGTTVPPAAATAAQLIAYADHAPVGSRRPARPGRRLVLVGGAAAVTAAVTTYVLPGRPTDEGDTPLPSGQVIVPIAYEFDTNPPPAAARLRALAAGIIDAPYDTRTGRYAYRHAKSWSATMLTSPEGFAVGFVEEDHQWIAPDGTGRTRSRIIGLGYPNEQSRRHWERELPRTGWAPPREDVVDLPFGPTDPTPTATVTAVPTATAPPPDPTRPPTHPAEIAERLNAQYGSVDAAKWTMEFYRSYVVPRQVRAEILLILAGLDGYVWRGTTTDRAGRTGVAIGVTSTPPPDNTDRNQYEDVLVFDPRTGGLLALERTILTPHREPDFYVLILDPGWTDRLG